VDLSDLERRRLWLSAQHSVRHAVEQIRHASGPQASPADRAAAQAAAAAASEMLNAVSWFVESKRGGPLRAAADSYDRAARDLHRRTVPATALSLRSRRRPRLGREQVRSHQRRPGRQRVQQMQLHRVRQVRLQGEPGKHGVVLLRRRRRI